MPKIDIAAVPQRKGSGYPPPFAAPCAERVRQRLGDAGGAAELGRVALVVEPDEDGSGDGAAAVGDGELVVAGWPGRAIV